MPYSSSSLIKVAMLGLNRAPLPEKLGLLGLEAPILGEKPEARLLEAAGFQSLAKKAGYQTVKVETKNHLDQAEAESSSYMDQLANESLKQILNGNNQLLLEEFLAIIRRRKQLISPEHLPKFFQWAMVMKLDRESYLPLIGQRGHWLASLHPFWQALLPPKPESWHYGTQEQRLDWLRYLRKQGPQQARALLQAEWKSCSYKELAKMVEILSIDLHQEDEELLLELSRHRRKEVRQVALQLLACLPEGQSVQRLQTYLRTWIQTDGDQWTLRLPDRLSDELQAEGLDQELPIYSGVVGEKGKWLVNLVSRVPPSFWAFQWKLSPFSGLEMIQADNWANELVLGIAFAALRFKDRSWAMALVQMGVLENSPFHNVIPPPLMEELIRESDSEEFCSCLVQTIHQTDHAEELASLFMAMIHHQQQLSEDLAWIFAKKLAGLLHHRTQHPYALRAFVYQLSDLSYFLPAPLYPRIAACWEQAEETDPWYEKHIEMALQILEFRYQMNGYESITPAC
ncbi:MAG: DUF5691 domain-containing protein [Bacteroidota bacterium]